MTRFPGATGALVLVLALAAALRPAHDVSPVAVAATPSPAPACDDPGSLCAMLRLVPDVFLHPENLDRLFVYADVAAQLAAVGVPRPVDDQDEDFDRYVVATLRLPVYDDLRIHADFWPEEMGFGLLDVDQTLAVGDPPNRLVLLRGAFDADAVVAAWTRAGYREIALAGAPVWKLRDDFVNDLRGGGVTTRLNAHNYAALPRPGLVLFASNATAMTHLLDAAAGRRASLAARPEVADLLANVEAGLAAAFAVPGRVVGSAGRFVLLTLTPGGPLPPETLRGTPLAWEPAPTTRCRIAVRYPDGHDVDAAAAAIAARLATGATGARSPNVPWTEVFADWHVTAVPTRSVVRIDLTTGEGVSPWIPVALIGGQDLGFLA